MNTLSTHRNSINHSAKWLLIVLVAILFCACSNSRQATAKQQPAKQEAKLVFPAQHKATPAHVGYVEDREALFTPQQLKSLDSLARNFERSNLIAIQILTISDPAITVENIETANKAALQKWMAQHGNSEKCMTISISKNLRHMRIDFGSFVRKLLSDPETKAIIDNQITPFYKQEQYFQGTVEGLKAIMDTIRGNIRF